MSRNLAAIFVLGWIAITGSGCRHKEETRATTLHFVTWKPTQPEVWDEVIRIFEQEHTTIQVERQVGPHSSSAYHDLLTQKLKNADPSVDVFFMDVTWPPEFAAAGWAEPLNERFPASEQEEYLPGPLLANTFRGQIYGIPLFVDCGMLYYRKDLLEHYKFNPPETWQEMVRQAEVIVKGEARKKRQIVGFSGQFKQYEGLVCNMMEYILSNGGKLMDPASGQVLIEGKEALEAVRFVRDQVIGKTAPKGVLTYEEPESLALFVQGRTAFMRNWPYAWEVSNNPHKSQIAGRVGISKLPHFPGGKSYSCLGGWQLGISRYSKKKDKAWTFVQFLSGPRIQKYLAQNASLAPTRKSLYEDEEIVSVHEQYEEMKEILLTAHPRPISPFYPALSNVLQSYFSRALSFQNSDIEVLARSAAQRINRIQKRVSLSVVGN